MTAQDQPPDQVGRFATLDGLRGVAAILVVLFHLFSRLPGWAQFGAHGYLAVDFFLMLSGFVIALSYERKLRAGQGLMAFFRRRAIRLYPVAMLGAAIGVAGLWVYQGFRAGGAVPFDTLLTASALNLLILPYFSGRFFDTVLFPANIALWSLFGEIAVNLVWAAAVLMGITSRVKLGVAIVAGTSFCLFIYMSDTANLGWGAHNVIPGVTRVIFCFLLGTLCYDIRHSIGKLSRFVNFPGLAAVLGVALLLPALHAGWDIFTILVLLPTILIGGISEGPLRRAPVRTFLGDISYPLYVIHYPILQTALRLHDKLFPTVPVIIGGLVAFLASVAAAIVVYYAFDLPVRRRLSRRRKTDPAST